MTDFNRAEGDEINLLNGISSSFPFVFRGELPGTFTNTIGDALPGGDLGTGFIQLWWARVGTSTFLYGDTNDNQFLDAEDFTVEFTGTSEVNLLASDFAPSVFTVLVGGPGDDTPLTVPPTAGNDTIFGVGGNDELEGAGGNDQIFGGAGNDTLRGGDGRDTLHGEAGMDTLEGDAGNDDLRGGDGDDILDGGVDGDTLRGDAGNDTLLGGFGADNLQGGADNDILEGGADNDLLTGSAGNDTLRGDDGADYLSGGGDNDILEGGAGEDTLIGGTGQDTQTGGAGADEFQFIVRANTSSARESTFATPDQVTDFNRAEGDEINLLNGISSSFPFVFRGELPGTFTNTVGDALPGGDLGTGFIQLWWARVGTSTFLYGDTNDNQFLDAEDFTVEFTGTSEVNLLASDLDGLQNIGPLARDDQIFIDNQAAFSDNLFVDNGFGVDFDPGGRIDHFGCDKRLDRECRFAIRTAIRCPAYCRCQWQLYI